LPQPQPPPGSPAPGRQDGGDPTKERYLAELVYREGHRNERRINDVKMPLVALGVVMSATFRLHAGPVAGQVAFAQVHDGVLSEWTFLMLFPILASAGPRFDRDVSRYAELMVTDRGRRLVAQAARFGAEYRSGRDTFWL
jgi:hypothetical protein